MDNFDIDSFLDSSFKMCSKKTKNSKLNNQIFTNTIDATIYNKLEINTLPSNNITINNLIKPLFPNETVFNKEFTSDKTFVLNKFINSKKEKERKKNKINFTKNLVNHLKSENLKFDAFLPMNKLWCEYTTNLMNKTNNLEIINNKILKCDLHGCVIEVFDSVNKNQIGIKGICIFESKKTFNLISVDDKIKTILKKGSIFLINLPYGNLSTKIIGDNFIFRSAERTKIKYKNKYNLNLNLFNLFNL